MSDERIRGSYDDALYKSTYTLLYIVDPVFCEFAVSQVAVNMALIGSHVL